MAIWSELAGMDPERVERVVDILAAQARDGHHLPGLVPDEAEATYDVLIGLGEKLRDVWLDDAEHGHLAPPTAVAMSKGAGIAILALIHYAEAAKFEAVFTDPEAQS